MSSRNASRVTRVFAINKPRDTVTDMTHPFFRILKQELMKKLNAGDRSLKIHPVGQLDKNTTGLFLFCTNGDAANFLNLPDTTKKTYVATYYPPGNRAPNAEQMKMLLHDGVDITRGKLPNRKRRFVVKVDECILLSTNLVESSPAAHPKYCYRLQLTVRSGANHLVKRLLSAVGLPPINAARPLQMV